MHETLKLSKRQAALTSQLCRAYYGARIHIGGAETPEKSAARKIYGTHSAKLVKRLFGLTLTPEEAFRSVHYHQTDWIITNPGSLAERMDLMASILKGAEQPEELDLRALFSTIYFVHDYEADGDRPIPTTGCGSVKLKDTPRSFYRLMYLARPKGINFDDMYKSGGLLTLCSPDCQFVAHVEFWKYELALRFESTAEHITGRRSPIVCGVPGARNGVSATSPLLKTWCDTLQLCLKSKWDVYPGNNFRV